VRRVWSFPVLAMIVACVLAAAGVGAWVVTAPVGGASQPRGGRVPLNLREWSSRRVQVSGPVHEVAFVRALLRGLHRVGFRRVSLGAAPGVYANVPARQMWMTVTVPSRLDDPERAVVAWQASELSDAYRSHCRIARVRCLDGLTVSGDFSTRVTPTTLRPSSARPGVLDTAYAGAASKAGLTSVHVKNAQGDGTVVTVTGVALHAEDVVRAINPVFRASDAAGVLLEVADRHGAALGVVANTYSGGSEWLAPGILAGYASRYRLHPLRAELLWFAAAACGLAGLATAVQNRRRRGPGVQPASG
jgi:hypothetical protein